MFITMYIYWLRASMGKTNETKKKIVRLLRKKDMTVTELSKELGLSTATVDQHMEELASMGLVAKQESEHFRKLKYYKLAEIKENKTGDSGMGIAKYMLGVIVLLGFLAVLSYYHFSMENAGALREAPAPMSNITYPANPTATTSPALGNGTSAKATGAASSSTPPSQANIVLPNTALASCPMIDYHLGGFITSHSNFTLYNRNISKFTIVPDYVIGRTGTTGNVSVGVLNAEEYVSNVLMQVGNSYNNVLFYNRTHYSSITYVNASGTHSGALNMTFYPETYNVIENSTVKFAIRVNPENSYNGTYIVRIDGPCLGGIGPILVTIGNKPYEGNNIIQSASIYS